MASHLTADLEANYRRFVDRVRATREVWVLLDPDLRGAWVHSNHYVTEDDEPVCVHLVYSAAAYARRHATGEWASMEPASLPLDQFLDGPLRGMHESGELLGPDFNADLAGLEIEPIELARALLGEP
ncbi:DUF2750 domain-containing protein [Mycobacterium attenuatum]|uniref:DUF2750 domain-containing protein n=1 Tax=Mycobacterium attenuatum TaxID=2341086 RepID=UPI000F011E01|nr:DUF2750 domain-containing protein [Mycobacterium attenuatum]VBA49230.1 hypothetical protein LAUMK191_01502 [Mycobacterium attenuatum]VBA54770.1 hypothetical protein LAUMK41_01575 [Mycobacterium attenuatum]